MKNNEIIITDEKGNSKTLKIYFTFENDNSKYVLCFDNDDSNTILPFKYDDKGNLYVVEDKKELDLIAECLDEFEKKGGDNEKNN